MQLTSEQLEKAAQIAYEAWYEGCRSWGESSEKHKEDMRNAIAAAFAAVEPPQVDVSGDLHKKAEMAAWEALGHGSGLVDSIQMMTIVGTVLRVALEDPRVLGNVVSGEPFTALHEGVIDSFLASRRARLLKPKTPESRVTIEEGSAGFFYVALDGKCNSCSDMNRTMAEIYRLGLIAKLKEEGAVSHETGGNAQ